MEKTSGIEVSENQSNVEENVLMTNQISLESLQNSLCSEKVINQELLKEIESMRNRFAGTIKMMKDDVFHLIEEKNLLQIKERQIEEYKKSLMSKMMAEIEDLKKQNKKNTANQQGLIQEQHRIIKELKAQLNAQKVKKENKAQNKPNTPSQSQDSDGKEKKDSKVNSEIPSDAKITDETLPKITRRKRRNIFYRAAHKVTKRVEEFVMLSALVYQYMFFLFVYLTERF